VEFCQGSENPIFSKKAQSSRFYWVYSFFGQTLLDSVRLILKGTTSKNNDVTIFIQCFNCSLMDKVLTFSLVSQLFMKNFTTPLLAQETKIGLKLGGGCLRWGYPIKPGGFVGCVLCTVPKCLNPEFLGDGKNVCHIDL